MEYILLNRDHHDRVHSHGHLSDSKYHSQLNVNEFLLCLVIFVRFLSLNVK